MLLEVAAMTLAATAFTLPIIAINFHRVSLAAPFANLFAVPAFVVVAITSGLAAVAALVLPGDAAFVGWLAWPPAAYLITVIRLFAGLPVASVDLRGIHLEHAGGPAPAHPASASDRRARGVARPRLRAALARGFSAQPRTPHRNLPGRRPRRSHPDRESRRSSHPVGRRPQRRSDHSRTRPPPAVLRPASRSRYAYSSAA